MRKKSLFPAVYLIVITVVMYLPILFVMIYSVNLSKISSVWTGFSFKWYRELFRDRNVGAALWNSLILGGNKIVLVGSLIQEQLMKVHDQPFAAALSVIMMLMMTVMIALYRRVTGSGEMEGMI